MQIQFNVVSVGCVTDTVRLTDMGWGGRKVVDGCISREGLIILAGGGGGMARMLRETRMGGVRRWLGLRLSC
jgi:hypothetical protein